MTTASAWKSCLMLAVLIGLTYVRAPAGEFLWDDEMIVGMLSNPHASPIRQALSLDSLEVRNYFRPLANLSFVGDFYLWGLNALGFRLANVLYHIGVVLLLFGFLRRYFGERAAFWSAALFAVHPVHAETVTPVFARCGIFEALVIPAFWLVGGPKDLPRRSWALRVAFSALLFVLALLSKESAVVFAAVFTVYLVLFRGTFDRAAWRQKLQTLVVLWSVALLFLFLRFAWIPLGTDQVLSLIAREPLPVRAWTFFESFARYLGLLLFPFELHMERHFVSGWASPLAWFGMAALGAGLVFAWKRRKGNPHLFFGLSWMLLWLSPVSNVLIPLPMTMAERWLYLPSVGVFWILAERLDFVFRKGGRKSGFVLLAVLVVFAGRTFARTLDWKDGATLYARDLEKSPNSFLLNNNLGVVEAREGRVSEAYYHFKRAVELEPNYGTAVSNLGAMEERLGNIEEASASYLKAIQISHYPLAYVNLAKILLRKGDRVSALQVVREGLAHHPYEGQLTELLLVLGDQ